MLASVIFGGLIGFPTMMMLYCDYSYLVSLPWALLCSGVMAVSFYWNDGEEPPALGIILCVLLVWVMLFGFVGMPKVFGVPILDIVFLTLCFVIAIFGPAVIGALLLLRMYDRYTLWKVMRPRI